MAEIGGAILSSVIQALLQGLAPGVTNFFRNSRADLKLRDKLHVTLLSANALLNDAEERQLKEDNVKNWIDELNKVLNEADHTMDEIDTEALRCEIEGKSFMKKLYPFDAFERKVKAKIEKIIERLEHLLDQSVRLGLRGGVPSKRIERSPAPLIGGHVVVYGREEDKEAIFKLLFPEINNEGNKISVIPIVGMGGVGKTTLARFVYDDSRVQNHFEHRAWVTVSDDFDVFKLAKLVFKELTTQESETEDLGKLRDHLEKFLGGKKFFLVLDDVWNENYALWTSLNSYFQVGGNGSKIIVTTRNEEIGRKMGSVQPHPLMLMADDDCWQLFEKHAFHNIEPSVCRELKEVGRAIVKKCKGLPLAVLSLAGLLCSVSCPKEWENILKSDVWDLHKKGQDEILPSLWLSYTYLSSHLKRCFAYCSLFPKDYEYRKKEIILMWMAEGLLQGESMEDEGEEYIKTLISRSLFQQSTKDESNFMMHDLVHDLATFVSGKGICTRLGTGDSLECLTNETHHLLLYGNLANFKGSSETNTLRTFVAESHLYSLTDELLHSILKPFGSLRVFCLSGGSNIRSVPDSIGKLKYLRYLDLSRTRIKSLPDTIYVLYNLQTLLLRNCTMLKCLPNKMENLIKLRHLDISGTRCLKEIPSGVYDLKALRAVFLTKLVVGRGCGVIVFRKSQTLSGYLEVLGLENIVDVRVVSEAKFEEKSNVTNLSLEWCGQSCDGEKHRAILDAMKPHPNLKKLNIRGYGGTEFSNWVVDLSLPNITEVTLSDCKHCCELPPFGQLPSLKKLKISGLQSVTTIATEFYGSSVPFVSLEILEITSMGKLQSWSFEDGAFPCLKKLVFRFPMLKSINFPHCLPSLQTLKIYECPQMETLVIPMEGDTITAFPSLMKISIKECTMLKSITTHSLPSLKTLKISSCPQMEALLLPTEMEMSTAFPSLENMDIRKCPNLEFSGLLPLPSSLDKLTLVGCEMIIAQRMQWGLKALRSLWIWKVEDRDMESFPEEGLLPTTVVYLNIWDVSNLKQLNGKGLQLTSLETLGISNCPKLHSLPEEGLPASLQILEVFDCKELGRRLKRETGEDWHKISHIPEINVYPVQEKEEEKASRGKIKTIWQRISHRD